MTPYRLLKPGDHDVDRVLGDTQVVDKGQNRTRGNTATTKSDQGIETRIVPALYVALLDQVDELPLGQNGAS